MTALIYIVEHIDTGKKYIGFTSSEANYTKRMSNYRRASENRHIHHAIRKYGWNAFMMYQIYGSKDVEHAKEMEKFFISYYDTFHNGYNTTLGGEGVSGIKFSDQERKNRKARMTGSRNPFYGRKHSEETKQILKIKSSNRQSPMKGKITPQSVRDKQSISAKNRKLQWQGYNYSVVYPDGRREIITNLAKFCQLNNLSKSSMCLLANGKIHTFKGYMCEKLKVEIING